ncbi:glutathione S-transferase [Shewanella maritima]|uniref:glutathione S-transferase n=1 Tax=Shewanella maritima TaxID=2520507 RepID=UPI0037355CF5
MNDHFILYSFRRCPYAMRARLGLHLSSLNPQIREIELRNKPEHMLAVSPKGTVPVLIVQQDQSSSSDKVLEESLDIMRFALAEYPRVGSFLPNEQPNKQQGEYLSLTAYKALQTSLSDNCNQQLIASNDQQFKPWLDKYKYADRHLEYSEEYYRDQACVFIQTLEDCLAQSPYLFGKHINLADLAIFPFIRQFAHVNKPWFESSPYPKVRAWLAGLMQSALFEAVMKKYPLWLDAPDNITQLK